MNKNISKKNISSKATSVVSLPWIITVCWEIYKTNICYPAKLCLVWKWKNTRGQIVVLTGMNTYFVIKNDRLVENMKGTGHYVNSVKEKIGFFIHFKNRTMKFYRKLN